MFVTEAEIDRLSALPETEESVRIGFRYGDKSTHSSRTLMLTELTQVLAAVEPGSPADAYGRAVVEENVTEKRTAATRSITLQRLRELYALQPTSRLFVAMRRLWSSQESGRSLLALQIALARDPLLRATASTVLAMPVGAELPRQALVAKVLSVTAGRLNERVADKAARNIASTWTQSGHLAGRVRKVRRIPDVTLTPICLALLLGHWFGQRGSELFESFWAASLGDTEDSLLRVAEDAKRAGLIELKRDGDITEVRFGEWAGVR